jgi:hypothetical protein
LQHNRFGKHRWCFRGALRVGGKGGVAQPIEIRLCQSMGGGQLIQAFCA